MKRRNASSSESAVLMIRVTPKSRKPGIGGVRNGFLTVAVAAAPERGKATEEARVLVAAWLGIPASRVTLQAGAASREKRLYLRGISAADLRKHLSERTGG